MARETYRAEMQKLIEPSTGFNFNGSTTSLARLKNFSIADMGRKIQIHAPELWDLLGILLDANLSCRRVAPDDSLLNEDKNMEIELDAIAMGVGFNNERSDGLASNNEDENVPATQTSKGRGDSSHSEEDTPNTPKKTYRKQNPAKHNAKLRFTVSDLL